MEKILGNRIYHEVPIAHIGETKNTNEDREKPKSRPAEGLTAKDQQENQPKIPYTFQTVDLYTDYITAILEFIKQKPNDFSNLVTTHLAPIANNPTKEQLSQFTQYFYSAVRPCIDPKKCPSEAETEGLSLIAEQLIKRYLNHD